MKIPAVISILKKKVWSFFHFDLIRNYGHTRYKKRCLLIYITFPFKQRDLSDRHQNIWQATELARIIGEFGYQVDVADYQNKYTRPIGKYDMVIGLIPRGIDIYSRHLNPNAVKIAYLTSSSIEYTNLKEMQRISELYARRGVKLKPRRQGGIIQKELEAFDGALLFGNEFTLQSYSQFNMPPVFFVANNGYEPDFDLLYFKNPKKFIYFGSAGSVHKGLDLLLEVFSEPEFPCELYVCGSVEKETDFVYAFQEELYHTANIHVLGRLNVHSDEYRKMVNDCAFSILPSCAEGQAGSVATMMSAGVISICSKDCGYDDDEVIILPDCSISTIREYVLVCSLKSNEWIEQNSKKAFNCYKTRHSQECFSKSIREGLSQILMGNSEENV